MSWRYLNLDEFAWNNVKDKLASLNLQLLLLCISDVNGRRSRTRLILSVVQGQPDPASPKNVREVGRYDLYPYFMQCKCGRSSNRDSPREDIIWGEVTR
jgi:hypothetical protein